MKLLNTLLFAFGAPLLTGAIHAAEPAPNSGSLARILPDGKVLECPLQHTSVRAEITGPMAQVVVRQDFINNSETAIEALYTFPLPTMAAVNRYEMHINERIIRGKIARREEAEKAFAEARRRGQTAGLLNQERPNVFRQALTNIPPHGKISVEITYVELVNYEAGQYEFAFPMVVGPRYYPQGGPNDARRVNPPVAAKGLRAGHDISLDIKIGGVPLSVVSSVNHAIAKKQLDGSRQQIQLEQLKEIPNKDFILHYKVAAKTIAPTFLTHREGNDGYFSFVIDPPAIRTQEMNITPKELVFVIDTSGSMMGFPLEKAKESMLLALNGLNPRDTFNLITFAGDTEILFPKPVPATAENLNQAKRFLESRQGRGGTEMMKAIRAALDGSDSQDHIRVVCFMTDGYIGNENEIIQEIRKHTNARVFSFGIGSSVNRYLLDKMAEAGRGEVEYVSLNSDGSAAARRFHERVRNPLLTDIELEWAGISVKDVVPARAPDLFSAKPLIVSGRYDSPGQGKLKIRGKQGGRPYYREIDITLPAQEVNAAAVPSIWARRKIDALSTDEAANREAIIQVGLKHGLMTQFTSYYAVEERIVNEGGKPRKVQVPVEMPDGVSHEGVFGNKDAAESRTMRATFMPSLQAPGFGGGYGGYEGGVVGGMLNGIPASAPPPIRRQEPGKTQDLAKKAEAVTGLIKIKVLLKDATPATLAKLKALGFVADPAPAGALFLSGKIDASKLEALRKLTEVTRIEELR
jgi:Ca-activated chloride channel homolog